MVRGSRTSENEGTWKWSGAVGEHYASEISDQKRLSDIGVKSKKISLGLKGRFYAMHVFMHKGKILRQSLRSVPNDKVLRNAH